ncbi:MAG: aldo/keto reductase, partial [Thermoanaerobaculia bacterium]
PERLREELEGSLRRLKVERIDLWQLHRIDSKVPEEDQFRAIVEFRRDGKVRHVGLSEVKVDEIERARKFFPVASVQNRYNLTDREWESVVDYCAREGIAFIPWYPLATGKLAAQGGRLAEIATRHQATPAQVALAWLLWRSKVMLPIPGTSSVKHLEENVAAAALRIPDAELKSLS